MDESRLEELERRLAKLEATFEKAYDGLFCRELELDCKVTTLQRKLRDYDVLMQIAVASHRVTHPEEFKRIRDGEDARSVLSMKKPADKL